MPGPVKRFSRHGRRRRAPPEQLLSTYSFFPSRHVKVEGVRFYGKVVGLESAVEGGSSIVSTRLSTSGASGMNLGCICSRLRGGQACLKALVLSPHAKHGYGLFPAISRPYRTVQVSNT